MWPQIVENVYMKKEIGRKTEKERGIGSERQSTKKEQGYKPLFYHGEQNLEQIICCLLITLACNVYS